MISATVGGVLAVVVILAAAVSAVIGGVFGSGASAEGAPGGCLLIPPVPAGTGAPTPGPDGPGSASPGGLAGLAADQRANAATIVHVGGSMGVPPYGWVIAVATALQESNLVNLGNLGDRNDHDSLGLFQQRPSQGWGTPAELTDPQYASHAFYAALAKVPGWQQMALTDAAQAVQRSAFPSAYAKHEAHARAIVADVVGASAVTCTVDGGDGQDNAAGVSLPPGYTLPAGTPVAVVTAIRWAVAQLGTPYHFGGSCTDAHGGNPATQCDCSSLMQQAYRAAGVSLPRIAADQFRVGVPVSRDQIQPGDLIFIPGSDGTMSAPGHVAMYVGAGILIQAPHSNDIVRLSLFDWQGLSGIRRVVHS